MLRQIAVKITYAMLGIATHRTRISGMDMHVITIHGTQMDTHIQLTFVQLTYKNKSNSPVKATHI